VLWAIAILGMVALGFSKDTRVSVLLKSIGTERTKNLYAARGATLYALNKLSEADNESTTESISNQHELGDGGLITSGEPPKEGGPATAEDDDTNDNTDSQDIGSLEITKWVPSENPYSIQIGDIYCDVYLHDENGKINLNGINDGNKGILIEYFTQMGIDVLDADVIADSILDWIDPDDLNHLNGAEDNYYGSLREPYKTKDAPFSSIEELVLIRGVTPEIFESIRNDITVYGGEQIVVNINIASKEILSSVLGLSGELVDELMLYIGESGPIKTSEELRQVFWDLGIIGNSFEKIKPYITIDQSDFVTISAVSRGSKMGYEYKLIAGKSDNKYKIHAVYPE
jgi:type II secretory pathway component PulK